MASLHTAPPLPGHPRRHPGVRQPAPASVRCLGALPARWARAALAALCLVAAGGAHAQLGASAPAPSAERQHELVRIVRQDCGSCHGLRLTGGLGPALTPEALADKPLDSMVATIYGGRPGTPMAPWKAMLSEADALWIAQQLFSGFPEPAKDRP